MVFRGDWIARVRSKEVGTVYTKNRLLWERAAAAKKKTEKRIYLKHQYAYPVFFPSFHAVVAIAALQYHAGADGPDWNVAVEIVGIAIRKDYSGSFLLHISPPCSPEAARPPRALSNQDSIYSHTAHGHARPLGHLCSLLVIARHCHYASCCCFCFFGVVFLPPSRVQTWCILKS